MKNIIFPNKLIKKYIFYVLLSIFILNQAIADSSIDTQVQDTIDTARKNYNIQAMSLSISLPNEKTSRDYVSGTLSKEDSTPIAPDNLYQVASITKNFTTILILQLVHDGKLSLDDKLGKFLPQYPKWKLVTIRELLNHTSGCFDYINSRNWWRYSATHADKIWASDELLKIAYKYPSYFAPGKGWHYSNTNYILAGLIIEKVTKESFEEQMRKLLLNAGLNNSYYYSSSQYPSDISKKIVHGYYQKYDQTMPNGSWGQGAGGLLSTPKEITQWVRELFNYKIISEDYLQEMQYLVSPINGRPTSNHIKPAAGLGMFTMNTPQGIVWYTPGLLPGYTSIWVYMPCSGIIISYSANSSLSPRGIQFHKEMLENISKILNSSEEVQKEVNIHRQSNKIPMYCHTVNPSKYWGFSKI